MSELLQAIEEMVSERDWVTFAELSRLEGMTGDGVVFAIRARSREVFLWADLSSGGAHAIGTLLDQHRVTLAPASLVAYLVDGAIFDNKNWLPVAFRPPDAANEMTKNGWLFHDPKRQRPSRRLLAHRQSRLQ